MKIISINPSCNYQAIGEVEAASRHNILNNTTAKAIAQELVAKRWGKRDFRVVDYVRFIEIVDWGQK